MSIFSSAKRAPSVNVPFAKIFPFPIVSERSPNARDRAEIGTFWVNSRTQAVYVLTKVAAGVSTWTNSPASGAAVMAALNLTTGDLLMDSGNIAVTAGDVDIVAGALNVGSTLSVAGATVISGNLTVVGDTTVTGDFDITNPSSVSITSTNDAASAIYLNANGGVSETIVVRSTKGTGVGSVTLNSVVGGITLSSALASADAINITASNAAGGIDMDAGSNGTIITNANGPFTVATGTGAISMSADATAVTANLVTGAGVKTLTIGSVTGASITTLRSGTGGLNVGTAAVDKTIAIGSTTGASAVNITAGTDGVVVTAPFVQLLTTKIYSGAGVPANGLALVAGDMYIRTDPAGATSRIYIATAASTWTNVSCAA